MARRHCGVARGWGEPHIRRDDGREPQHRGRPHRSHQALAYRLHLSPLELCSAVLFPLAPAVGLRMSTRKGPLTGCSIMTSSWYRRIFPNRLAAHRAREERLTTRRVAGIAISFAGVVLVIAKGTSALVHE